jgi:hypothetical protein
MTSRNSQAMGLAIVAGILLLIAGVSGLATWETIKDFVTTHVIDNAIVQIIFVILIFIASLGGIAVIIGGLLIGKNKVRTGKFVIALGAGLGLIGLIVSLVIAIVEGSFTLSSFLSIGAIGVILSIVARIVAVK